MTKEMSDSALVLCETREGVATITLNRPEKLNALNQSLYVELDAVLQQVDADASVRAVVLTGAGRCFSVGADLSGGPSSGVLERWGKQQSTSRRQLGLWETGKPIIAAVHGYCLGRGLELALWCDIIVAAEDTRLGQPEVRDGWFVASIMPWVIDPQHAKLLMLTGDQIDAYEAERIGLVTRVVPTGQAQSEALKLAQRLTHVPPVLARSVKRWVNGIYEQMGLRLTQTEGTLLSTLIASMTASERGTEELERIRKEQGFKAYLEARDGPFRTKEQ